MKRKNTPQMQMFKKTTEAFSDNIKIAVKFRYIAFFGFGFGILVLKLLGIYPAPWIMFWIILFLIIFTFIWSFVLLKTKTRNDIPRANKFYFFAQIIEITVILASVHLSGMIAFMGAFIFVVYFFHSYFPYTQRKYYFILFIYSIIGYTTVLSLEYLGVLNVVDFYNIGVTVKYNSGLFIISLTLGISLTLFIFLIADAFLRRLQKSLKTSIQKETALLEAKKILEIKVKARTQALEEERNSLEMKVEERTKELQEKLGELERFHKLAVGRELKMIELKKEINKFKNKKT